MSNDIVIFSHEISRLAKPTGCWMWMNIGCQKTHYLHIHISEINEPITKDGMKKKWEMNNNNNNKKLDFIESKLPLHHRQNAKFEVKPVYLIAAWRKNTSWHDWIETPTKKSNMISRTVIYARETIWKTKKNLASNTDTIYRSSTSNNNNMDVLVSVVVTFWEISFADADTAPYNIDVNSLTCDQTVRPNRNRIRSMEFQVRI